MYISHSGMANENGDIDVNEHDGSTGSLPVELWTPSKKIKDNKENNHQEINGWAPCENHRTTSSNKDVSDSSPKKHSEKKKLSYEEILQLLEEKVKNLLSRDDFTTADARPDLKFIQRQTRYSPDVVLNRRIVERIVKLGTAHVFLRVWRSVSTVDYLDSQHYPAFRNLQTALSIIWNCTDKSPMLCDCLVRCGIIQLFLEQLYSDQLTNSTLENENELYLVKAYLGMLHNIVRLCSDSRKFFRSANGVQILQFYLKSDQVLVKTKAYLILSYIINDTENDVINATDENIEFIIGILREALNSENHFSKTFAFWASEIVCGLNHLAVNDSNKVRICDHGALSLYFTLLQGDNLEEQNLGVAGLWILAFHDQNKQLIKSNSEYMEALKNLANNAPQESVRRSARGALWVIRSAPARPSPAPSPLPDVEVDTSDVPHVMISYHWANQSTLIKVRNQLAAAGFKVWMDIDNMSGSTLEAMALAVERAAVVLVAMSQGYKDSPSCRTEAEYTYRQRKDIIPLLLQPGYVPDGWLGILVGTRIFFDLSNDETLDMAISKLIKEIGNRGKCPSMASLRADLSPRSRDNSECSDSLSSSMSSTSSLHTYIKVPAARTWNQQHVRHWLTSHQLYDVAERFERFNGELLLQYKKMMETAPEYFYNSLEKQMRLDLVTSLQFAKALESLT